MSGDSKSDGTSCSVKLQQQLREREEVESGGSCEEDDDDEEEEEESDSTESEFSSSESSDVRRSTSSSQGNKLSGGAGAIRSLVNDDELHKGMGELECHFTKARATLYRERLLLVKRKISAVKNGTSPELMKTIAKLQEELKERTNIAEILHEKRMDAIRIKKDAFALGGKQNSEEKKSVACDKIRDKIQQKAFDLEMERVEARERKWLSGARRELKRKEMVGGSGRKKVREICQPYLIYELEEDEIAEDVRIIERNIAAMEYGIIL